MEKTEKLKLDIQSVINQPKPVLAVIQTQKEVSVEPEHELMKPSGLATLEDWEQCMIKPTLTRTTFVSGWILKATPNMFHVSSVMMQDEGQPKKFSEPTAIQVKDIVDLGLYGQKKNQK